MVKNLIGCWGSPAANQILRHSNPIFSTNNLQFSSQQLHFNDLVYTCHQCLSGQYSLQRGYFKYWAEVNVGRDKRSADNGTKSHVPRPPPNPFIPPPPPPPPVLRTSDVTRQYHYIDAVCHPCPYGGVCNQGIQAKANQWGVATDGIVTFHKCPTGYCCSKPTCPRYNSCEDYRTGTLCSGCEPGYSEALFSTKCLSDKQCNQFWFIPVTGLLIFIYAMFLLFQNNFKDFLLGAPIGKQTMKKTLNSWMQARKHRKSRQQPQQPKIAVVAENIPNEHLETHSVKEDDVDTDEGGIFLILLFYYFQDAAIVHFEPVHAQVTDPVVALLKKFVGSLFKFQFDILVFAGNICPFPGLDPVSKVWLKLMFIPLLFVILIAIYCLAKIKIMRPHTKNQKWKDLSGKASMAIMLAVLFSYQKLAFSAFLLVYCVPVANENVLFIDGKVNCLQNWQVGVLFYIYLCIVPFGVYIAVTPSYLQARKLTIGQYFLGCFLPAPMVLITFFVRCVKKLRHIESKATDKKCSQIPLIYRMLQGPYKDYYIPLPFIKDVSLCWSGILLIRRLSLIITHMYVHNIVLRLLTMTVISFFALLHHLIVKPCKENRANTAGTISCAALLSVCLINLIRATFEVAEFTPEGHLRDIMDGMKLIEDCLLFWIPLVGAGIMLLFLIGRFSSAIVQKCTKHKKSDS